jgi:hypothetical protein
MRRRFAWIAYAVLLADTLLAVAHAQTPAPTDARARPAPVVELIVVGGGADAVVLIGTIDQLLGGVGIATESHAVRVPEDVLSITRGAAAARVQVDLRDPDAVVLIVEGHGQTSRRRLRRDPSAAVTREEVAQAVESAVQAEVLSESEASRVDGSAPAPTSPVAVAPTATSPEWTPPAPVMQSDRPSSALQAGSPLSLDLSALAGAGWLASGIGALPEVEGQVALSWENRWRPSIVLAGRAVLPFEGSGDSVTGQGFAIDPRLLVKLDVLRNSWVSLAPGVGAGLDVISMQPRSSTLPSSALGSATTRIDPVGTILVAARAAIGARLSADLMVAGDVDFLPPRYVVDAGSARDAVISPWRVRPVFLLGLTFTPAGPVEFERGEARR